MVALLAVSVLTALLHGTLPAAVCAGVHIAVTACVSVFHVMNRKPQPAPLVGDDDETNR